VSYTAAPRAWADPAWASTAIRPHPPQRSSTHSSVNLGKLKPRGTWPTRRGTFAAADRPGALRRALRRKQRRASAASEPSRHGVGTFATAGHAATALPDALAKEALRVSDFNKAAPCVREFNTQGLATPPPSIAEEAAPRVSDFTDVATAAHAAPPTLFAAIAAAPPPRVSELDPQ